ncbi:hypothetical protein [Dactylosporangium darangshiense]
MHTRVRGSSPLLPLPYAHFAMGSALFAGAAGVAAELTGVPAASPMVPLSRYRDSWEITDRASVSHRFDANGGWLAPVTASAEPGGGPVVDAVVADAVERLKRWDGVQDDCLTRVDEVLTAVGVPSRGYDAGMVVLTPKMVAARLGGEFRPAAVADLIGLAAGMLTVVWVQRPDGHRHVVVVHRRSSDEGLVVVETQTAGVAGRYQEIDLARPTEGGLPVVPLVLQGALYLPVDEDGRLLRVDAVGAVSAGARVSDTTLSVAMLHPAATTRTGMRPDPDRGRERTAEPNTPSHYDAMIDSHGSAPFTGSSSQQPAATTVHPDPGSHPSQGQAADLSVHPDTPTPLEGRQAAGPSSSVPSERSEPPTKVLEWRPGKGGHDNLQALLEAMMDAGEIDQNSLDRYRNIDRLKSKTTVEWVRHWVEEMRQQRKPGTDDYYTQKDVREMVGDLVSQSRLSIWWRGVDRPSERSEPRPKVLRWRLQPLQAAVPPVPSERPGPTPTEVLEWRPGKGGHDNLKALLEAMMDAGEIDQNSLDRYHNSGRLKSKTTVEWVRRWVEEMRQQRKPGTDDYYTQQEVLDMVGDLVSYSRFQEWWRFADLSPVPPREGWGAATSQAATAVNAPGDQDMTDADLPAETGPGPQRVPTLPPHHRRRTEFARDSVEPDADGSSVTPRRGFAATSALGTQPAGPDPVNAGPGGTPEPSSAQTPPELGRTETPPTMPGRLDRTRAAMPSPSTRKRRHDASSDHGSGVALPPHHRRRTEFARDSVEPDADGSSVTPRRGFAATSALGTQPAGPDPVNAGPGGTPEPSSAQTPPELGRTETPPTMPGRLDRTRAAMPSPSTRKRRHDASSDHGSGVALPPHHRRRPSATAAASSATPAVPSSTLVPASVPANGWCLLSATVLSAPRQLARFIGSSDRRQFLNGVPDRLFLQGTDSVISDRQFGVVVAGMTAHIASALSSNKKLAKRVIRPYAKAYENGDAEGRPITTDSVVAAVMDWERRWSDPTYGDSDMFLNLIAVVFQMRPEVHTPEGAVRHPDLTDVDPQWPLLRLRLTRSPEPNTPGHYDAMIDSGGSAPFAGSSSQQPDVAEDWPSAPGDYQPAPGENQAVTRWQRTWGDPGPSPAEIRASAQVLQARDGGRDSFLRANELAFEIYQRRHGESSADGRRR